MEIDSPPSDASSDTLSPRDRILQRLGSINGVPEKNVERLQHGLVDFLKNNKFRMAEIVYAILPTDEEAGEAVSPRLTTYFHESLFWLQWLMFEDEPGFALKRLANMCVGQRGVCGSVWGNNDIAYRCRTCEHDPTCAICVPCFKDGNHKDHDYSIIYTGGGCCDCGDVTAWKREGFCSKHKGAEQIQPLSDHLANTVRPVLDLLLTYWKAKLCIAENVSEDSPMVDEQLAEPRKIANVLTSEVLQMLLEFCQCSESLLSFISGRMISLVGLIDIMVRAERFLSDDVVKKLHELLLKLLGDPPFKYEFAKVFLNYYPTTVSEAIKESSDNVFRKYPLLSTFSVQILTVPTLTPRLVKENHLLLLLLECLENIFISCAGEDGRLQVSDWGSLYETTLRVVEDIRFVMSHPAVPRYVTHDRKDLLRMWMRLLAFVQGMNPQKRETGIHIEEESDNMHLPFVLGHSIANIHSLLVAGAFFVNAVEMDDDIFFNTTRQDIDYQDTPRHAKVGRLSEESSVSCATSSTAICCASKVTEAKSDETLIESSVSWFTFECLKGIENWLRADNTSGDFINSLFQKLSGNKILAFKKKLSKTKKGKSMFRSHSAPSESSRFRIPDGLLGVTSMASAKLAVQDCNRTGSGDNSTEGEFAAELENLHILSLSDWPDIEYDVSSEDISVHIPLHRLLSLVLQKTLKRCYGDIASSNSLSNSGSSPALYQDFFANILGGCHPYGFSAFVMEHPLRIRVFCAEVHAGMWRKNGDAPILSWEWYRSVRWSEQGLELDLFLMQCCAALAPADPYVTRILERFGLSNYLYLSPVLFSEYEPILVQDMLTLIIQIVKERRFSRQTAAECLQRELIYKLAIGDSTRSQLVKSLPRDLSKLDQLQEILDRIAIYSNPSGMNQGMYKLRLQYWKELDLYHPRWNSKDLQVAEERYLRFCNTSALTNQLPKWTSIYHPLSGVAKVGTCKVVLQIVRAVLFYAVCGQQSTASRAPEGVLLTALHLLSLSLDICFEQRRSGDLLGCMDDPIPILAFAGEEVCAGPTNASDNQSLLSLLVSLMRMHKKEHPNIWEASFYDMSSLIESMLKKFAELDSGCMIKLTTLAPEVVKLPDSSSNVTKDGGLQSEIDMRKAKARERQAAVLEKMRAQQSIFLESLTSSTNDDSENPKCGEAACSSDIKIDSGEPKQEICSLCHDPTSRSPLCYLILLQKSRILSLVDRGPPSWEHVCLSGQKHHLINSSNLNVGSGRTTASSSSESIPSSQLNQLVQNAVDEFASDGQPKEINAFIEFMKARFPSVRNIQLPQTSKQTGYRAGCSLETLEERMYLSTREKMHDHLFSDFGKEHQNSATGESSTIREAESFLLGKYIACLSKETQENASASENIHPPKTVPSESSSQLAYDGLNPPDCDGIHVSSCGHAVHLACLDRYLSSLKERSVRRIVFEGGQIVNPEQGEFLCPVCRGLANSVLPDFTEAPQKNFGPLKWPVILLDATNQLPSVNNKTTHLRLREGFAVLQCASDVARSADFLNAFPVYQSGKISPSLESMTRALSRLYFPGNQDKTLGSARISHSVIMWDTLKYSLISTEIAARCGKTSLAPCYGLSAIFSELKSTSGYMLSLLLKIVQSTRTQNSLCVLIRLRGLQLLAESVCSGISLGEFRSQMEGREGCMSSLLRNAEMDVAHPDIQFWRRASDPILSRDPFSSLMWALFCLPSEFLYCEESFLSLVHTFYVVSVAQAIITYCGKYQHGTTDLGSRGDLIFDILKIMEETGVDQPFFASESVDLSDSIEDAILNLSFPYLRRCALLLKVMNSSTTHLCNEEAQMSGWSSETIDSMVDYFGETTEEVAEVKRLQRMFKIPPLEDVLNDELLRRVVPRWFQHISKDIEPNHRPVLHLTPAIPFKLMGLPHLYQDLLQRCIKQLCPDCQAVPEEPALCLLCGKLCSPTWKMCCRDNGSQTHAITCGAGTGVFLLIKKSTILLQRSARLAPWPSPYLDAFGEEDIDMRRGKPLYLNEERYAALTYMVASHGLDRSSKVLRLTTIGSFFML